MKKSIFIITAAINILSVSSLLAKSYPGIPIAVSGINSLEHQAFTLMWEPVTQTSNGTQIENLAGYNIYRRSSPNGTPTKLNSFITPLPVFADRINGQTYYYSVRAVMEDGTESKDSWLVDSSADNNIHFTSEDGYTSVKIPGNLSKLFKPEHNKYGVALTLKTEPGFVAPGSSVLRSSKVMIVRGDTSEVLSDISFPTADVEIKLGFDSINGVVSAGLSNSHSITSHSSRIHPDQLSLYWNNGVNWIKLGGALDSSGQFLSVNSSQVGQYQIRAAAPANSLSLNKNNVYPRIFTPNGDGFNDRVYIVLENPDQISVSANIYDLSGRFISSLNTATGLGTSTTLTWNGNDQNGTKAPSGEYLYRINGDEQALNGVISLAR